MSMFRTLLMQKKGGGIPSGWSEVDGFIMPPSTNNELAVNNIIVSDNTRIVLDAFLIARQNVGHYALSATTPSTFSVYEQNGFLGIYAGGSKIQTPTRSTTDKVTFLGDVNFKENYLRLTYGSRVTSADLSRSVSYNGAATIGSSIPNGLLAIKRITVYENDNIVQDFKAVTDGSVYSFAEVVQGVVLTKSNGTASNWVLYK